MWMKNVILHCSNHRCKYQSDTALSIDHHKGVHRQGTNGQKEGLRLEVVQYAWLVEPLHLKQIYSWLMGCIFQPSYPSPLKVVEHKDHPAFWRLNNPLKAFCGWSVMVGCVQITHQLAFIYLCYEMHSCIRVGSRVFWHSFAFFGHLMSSALWHKCRLPLVLTCGDSAARRRLFYH